VHPASGVPQLVYDDGVGVSKIGHHPQKVEAAVTKQSGPLARRLT
jgi:hypothetical protein